MWGGALSGAGKGAATGAVASPWGAAIGGAIGLLSGLFGGDKKEEVGMTRVDPRLPPTVVDMFSQMGYAPEQRSQIASGLMPLIMSGIFRGLGGSAPGTGGGAMPNYGQIPQASNIWELYGLNPQASLGPGISARKGTPGYTARDEAMNRLKRLPRYGSERDEREDYYGY